MNTRTFADNLRRAVYRSPIKNLTELAERVGTPVSNISAYAKLDQPKGSERLPGLKMFLTICKALEMTPDEVLGWECADIHYWRNRAFEVEKVLDATLKPARAWEDAQRREALKGLRPHASILNDPQRLAADP